MTERKKRRSIAGPGIPEAGCDIKNCAMIEQEATKKLWERDARQFYEKSYADLSTIEQGYIRRGVEYPQYRGRLTK